MQTSVEIVEFSFLQLRQLHCGYALHYVVQIHSWDSCCSLCCLAWLNGGRNIFFCKDKLYSQYISFLKNDFALQALHMYKELPFHSPEVIYLCNLWCGCRLHLSVQAPSWRP